MNKYKAKGFTLLELMVVIIIASILGVIVMVTFYNPSSESYEKTLASAANSLTAATATNYRLSRSGSPNAISISNCTDAPNTLKNGNQIPAGYSITPQAVAVGTQVSCTLTAPNGDTAQFQAIGTD